MKSILTALCALFLSGTAANAAFVNFTTIADAGLLDNEGDGIFDSVTTNATILSIRTFNTAPIPAGSRFEERSVAEFNLTSLAAGTTISSAAFRFQTFGLANSSTRVDIFGYAGDGQATLGDATIAAVLLGSYDPVALGLGLQEVTLNTAAFSALFATTRTIGLRFQGIYPTNTQFASLEGSSSLNAVAPTLVLNATAAVPEPSSVALLGVGLFSALGLARAARRGSDRRD